MSYQRNGQLVGAPAPESTPAAREPGAVRVNGFHQVIEMLRHADPEFRDSLLRRMAKQDPELTANLRHTLAQLGL